MRRQEIIVAASLVVFGVLCLLVGWPAILQVVEQAVEQRGPLWFMAFHP